MVCCEALEHVTEHVSVRHRADNVNLRTMVKDRDEALRTEQLAKEQAIQQGGLQFCHIFSVLMFTATAAQHELARAKRRVAALLARCEGIFLVFLIVIA